MKQKLIFIEFYSIKKIIKFNHYIYLFFNEYLFLIA